ncbi:MAG: integrase [Candidatus Portnoybacteria bacterium CG10_big_fil_rev_8_21_14_0_10_44_7]|uniref:Integrase n=1 Tax=Candidatus Portnoybacteria bacterium CG10_big_fil_rev_8_21_14_0_10_44_7 TaxID=1974816 RepID=A0A2M8KJ86_9BACT|nr:MAG: integrase [Candidatus Portnoybacteria bacterium CG10_big_fil_rev_8_21_14_0_10_44_7]
MNLKELLEKIKNELKLRNYGQKTIKSYLGCLSNYFRFIKDIKREPNIFLIKKYLLAKHNAGQSPQTVNLHLQAIKYFYREIAKSRVEINLKFAKTSKRLPVVLARGEIKKVLDSIKNEKHRLMVALAYGAGLRVGETVNLKINDVDLDELVIHIKSAKGKKDRITVFPEKLKADISRLAAIRHGNEYLFASGRGGKLAERTAQMVFGRALKKSGIKKDATFHSLRHSFATHLLENGINVRYVQELLGHANIRTTQIYTQVTNPKLKNIKSPFDD